MRLGWLFVGFLFGITYGIFAPVVETAFADLFNDNPTLEQFVGGTLNVELYLQMIMQYGGFLAAASAVTFALGAVGEEERGVTAGLLSAPVARLRWLASRITVLVIGSGALLLALGLGLLGSAIPLLLAGDYLDADAARHLATSTALGVVTQWPATLLLGALVVAVHGLVPRGAKPLGWGLFVLVLFLTLFAPVLNPPQWVLNLSPFTHVPALPTTSGNSIWGDAAAWAGPGICLFLAAILMIVGLWGMRRRDLMA